MRNKKASLLAVLAAAAALAVVVTAVKIGLHYMQRHDESALDRLADGFPDFAPIPAATFSEPGTCSVILTEVGDKRTAVLQVLRDILGLGLREGADFIDVPGGKTIRVGISFESAEAIVRALEYQGATAEISF